MKTFILILSFFCLASVSYAQKQILSYEDLKYLIENNLGKADTFLVAKGYSIKSLNKKNNSRKYTTSMQGGTKSEVEVRADGKKMFVEIATDDISQYNMIHNSIAQFLITSGNTGDVQTYNVKELGSIYITVTDTVPYSPIKKDYDIHLVSDRRITSYNWFIGDTSFALCIAILLPVFKPYHQFQARPYLVNGANFHINQAILQGFVSD